MTDWKNIRGVIFDLDGTLYDQIPVRICMLIELLFFFMAFKISRQKILALRFFRNKYEDLSSNKYECAYNLSIEKTAQKFNLSPENVLKITDEWLINRPLKYIKLFRSAGVETTFKKLADLGIKIAVFSNYPTEKKIAALGLSPDFQISPSRSKLRYVKPHPNGISIILAEFDIKKNNLLLIGDRIDHDGECATLARINFLHKNNNKFFVNLNQSFN